ncbi:tetratricopeptide repeat protein [Streptomyces sp. TRM49041]|uniref:tetratricopeptide repeat protein n=1 Tax=Streptomyces sp. TRM49041 TaxID=2603216 RepID=UPI0021CC7CB5|nr:tetratricopeptide repeat protein [Streptomyces sp. TRM49041]
MIQRLCGLLEDAGVDLSTEELLDVLWLAVTTRPDGREPGRAAATPAATTAMDEPPEETGTDGAAAKTGARHGGATDEPRPRRGTDESRALYAPGRTGTGGREHARAVGVRGVRAIPAARRLHRSLRVLRQPVPSRTSYVLDETATADWVADTALPDVILRPETERWLDAVLVVDDGPSMVLWQQYAAETRTLLERHGIFQRVRTYGLDSGHPDRAVVRARPFRPSSARRPARRLGDQVRPTVVLVLSDGVGPGWRSGAVHALLRRWAAHSPVAIVQPLPERLWPSPGMPAEHLLVTADRPAAPGRALKVRHPVLPRELLSYEGTAIPVLELEEGRLASWARLILDGAANGPLPVVLLPDSGQPDGVGPPVEAERGTCDLSADDHFHRFRQSASPEGRQLAGALASVRPLTLPVMRLVHQAHQPGSGRFHPAQLAEVFLGGLLRRAEGRERRGPDTAEYEFLPGVAELLLDTVRTSHALDTAARVSEFLLTRRGTGPEFRARLSGGEGESTVGSEAGPFAAASPQLLRRLGLSQERPRTGTHPEPDPMEASDVDDEHLEDGDLDVSLAHVWSRMADFVRRLAGDPDSPAVVTQACGPLMRWVDRPDPGRQPIYDLDGLASALTDARQHADAAEFIALLREGLEPFTQDERLAARSARGHLAIALSTLGETAEAVAHLLAIIDVSGRVHGPEHAYTLNARRHLHDMYWRADRLEDGEAEGRVLIGTLRRLPPSDDLPDLSDIQLVQGFILMDLGRFQEAQAAFGAAHSDSSARLGAAADRDRSWEARGWLASALVRQERLEEAEAEARDVLAQLERTEGGARPGLGKLTTLDVLADVLERSGRTDELVQARRAVVEASEYVYGPDTRRTVAARRNWIASLRDAGERKTARREAEALAQLARSSLGERHIETVKAQEEFVRALADEGEYEEAEARQRAVLDQVRRDLGAEHPATLSVRHNLGWLLHGAGRPAEAEAILAEVLRDRTRFLGEEHGSTRVTWWCRALALDALGRREEAESALRALLDVEIRTLRPHSLSLAQTRRALGDVLRDAGRLQEAEEQYRLVHAARCETLGREAPPTLTTAHTIGALLNEAGRYEEAAALLEEVAASRERVLGGNSAHTLRSRVRLGVALDGLGRRAEAVDLWRAVLADAVRELGEDHERVVETRRLLGAAGAAET